jgi:hypothetical protein
MQHCQRRGRDRWWAARIAVLVVTTALIVLWATAQAAHGGTYVMRSCNVPKERPAPAAPWDWVNTTNTYANDECGSGGGFGINAGQCNERRPLPLP